MESIQPCVRFVLYNYIFVTMGRILLGHTLINLYFSLRDIDEKKLIFSYHKNECWNWNLDEEIQLNDISFVVCE